MFTQTQAMNFVASTQPGQEIKIRVARGNGTLFTTQAVLEARPLLEQGG
jgi:hypothetical protein